jgi:hypothetical protein
MAINDLTISYPDFQLGQIIDPEKFDTNNGEIEDKINEVIAQVNTNETDIATAEADIATNTADIATNAADIATNAADIATNTSYIETNSLLINDNANNILLNSGFISANSANIAINTADIVTANLLIEIKEAKRYKEAIGQLLTYSKQIKNKFPVLYLFSRNGNLLTYKEQNNIFNVCRQNKIWFYQHNPANPYGFIYWLAGRKFITKVPYNVQNRIENKNLYKDVDKTPCKVYDSKGKLVKTIY